MDVRDSFYANIFVFVVTRCVLLLERSSSRVSAQVWYHHHGWTTWHVLGKER